MMYIFKMIQQVAGKNSRSLYLPVALSCVDALLHMGMFSTMILTIIPIRIATIFIREHGKATKQRRANLVHGDNTEYPTVATLI